MENEKIYSKKDVMTWYKHVKTHTVEEAFNYLNSLSPTETNNVSNVDSVSLVDAMYYMALKAIPDHFADLGEGMKLNTGKFLRKKWIEGFEAALEWQKKQKQHPDK